MSNLWEKFVNYLKSLFFKHELEMSIVGIQNAGKSTLVHTLSNQNRPDPNHETMATIGFVMKKVKIGNVDIKRWDVGGKKRKQWEKYCRAVDVMIFVVDSADHEKIPEAKEELHNLMSKPNLEGIPLLVLGNKNDLETSLGTKELSEQLALKEITGRTIGCYSISAKNAVNIDNVLKWLMQQKRVKK